MTISGPTREEAFPDSSCLLVSFSLGACRIRRQSLELSNQIGSGGAKFYRLFRNGEERRNEDEKA